MIQCEWVINMKNKYPKHEIILKIVWGIGILTSLILLIIATIVRKNDVESDLFIYIFTIGILTLMFVLVAIPRVFEIEFDKMKKQRDLYKKERGKVLEEEFRSIDADVHHREIKKRVKSVKEGLTTEVCPKCGDKFEADEDYCNKCGIYRYKTCPKCKSINGLEDNYCRSCGKKLK